MARMDEVARRWASGDGKRLKGGSASYREDRLYSWGTCIGRLVDSVEGRVALITNLQYSDSTSRLTNLAVAMAGKADLPVFRVEMVGTDPPSYAKNLAAYEAREASWKDKSRRARNDHSAVSYLQQAEQVAREGRRYRQLFAHPKPHTNPPSGMPDAIPALQD
jgi:hypothetical protein